MEKIICRCEEISENEIVAAIKEGATSIRGVKIRTRAGMGTCQGRTCYRNVLSLLQIHKKTQREDIFPNTLRTPFYPITWKELLGDLNNEE